MVMLNCFLIVYIVFMLWAIYRLNVGAKQRLELIDAVYWQDPELDWDKNMDEILHLSTLFGKVSFDKHIWWSILLLNPLELYDVEIIRKKARYDAAH